jgi:AraC-like DNA-binding protein
VGFFRTSDTLDSAEAFSEAVGPLGWAGDFRQLRPGRETVAADALLAPGVTLLRVSFGGALHQRALPPAGNVTFGIPCGPQAPGRMGRRPLESETVNCFDAAGGIDVVSKAGFSAYTVSFDEQLLAGAADRLGLRAGGGLEQCGGTQVWSEPATLAALRRLLFATFMHSAQPLSLQARCNLLRDIAAELPERLLCAWRAGERLDYVPASKRQRVLRRALCCLHDNPDEALTVERLCVEAACSVSTLERAFREHFGVGPKRYMTAMRLSAVRRRLINPAEQRAIADLAAAAGFWHMSKFAADYRLMFGELPSQTRAGAR